MSKPVFIFTCNPRTQSEGSEELQPLVLLKIKEPSDFRRRILGTDCMSPPLPEGCDSRDDVLVCLRKLIPSLENVPWYEGALVDSGNCWYLFCLESVEFDEGRWERFAHNIVTDALRGLSEDEIRKNDIRVLVSVSNGFTTFYREMLNKTQARIDWLPE